MNLLLEIPDRIAETLPASPAERQREMRFALACGLFAMGEADSGSSAELAGMSRLGFLEAYGKHGLQRPYHDEDLTDDIAFARHRLHVGPFGALQNRATGNPAMAFPAGDRAARCPHGTRSGG